MAKKIRKIQKNFKISTCGFQRLVLSDRKTCILPCRTYDINMSRLRTCKTCRGKVAKSAACCPHCGAKLPRHFGFSTLISLVVIIAAGYYVFGGVCSTIRSTTSEIAEAVKSTTESGPPKTALDDCDVSESGGTLNVVCDENSGFTTGLTITSIELTRHKVLEEASKRDVDEVHLLITLDLIDGLGNVVRQTVLDCRYDINTLKQINWENAPLLNFDLIATDIRRHPVITK